MEIDDDTVKTFAPLSEALAEAEKYPRHSRPDDDPWTEYATIRVAQAVELPSLDLPTGYTLIVHDGGSINIDGALNIDPADDPTCFGKGGAIEQGVFEPSPVGSLIITTINQTADRVRRFRLYGLVLHNEAVPIASRFFRKQHIAERPPFWCAC